MTESFKIIAVAVLIVAGTSAKALPSANLSASSYTGNGLYGAKAQFIYAAGTASSSISNPEGYVGGSATVSPFQRVSAEGSGSGYRNQGIESAAGTYYFGIIGPSAVEVPIILSGSAAVYASGGSSASVYETYGRNGGTYSNFGPVNCYSGSSNCGAFTFIQHYSLVAGTGTTAGDVGFTTLRADVLAQEGSASAFIDPIITIDPNFANADQYRIVFGPGAGNPGVVPEPAGWAMLLTGFGFAGGALRLRRQALRVAA